MASIKNMQTSLTGVAQHNGWRTVTQPVNTKKLRVNFVSEEEFIDKREIHHVMAEALAKGLIEDRRVLFGVTKRHSPAHFGYVFEYIAEVNVADTQHSSTMAETTKFIMNNEEFTEDDLKEAVRIAFPERLI